MKTREYQKAITHYRKALDLNPGAFALYYALMSCHSLLDQIQEAIEAIEKYLEYVPGDPEALASLGALKSKLPAGSAGDGAEELEQSMATDPESRVVPSMLLDIYMENNQLEKIETMLKTYTHLELHYLFQFKLSQAFEHFGKLDEARASIIKFLEKYEYFFQNESLEANQHNQPLFEEGIEQLKKLNGDPALVQRFETAMNEGLNQPKE